MKVVLTFLLNSKFCLRTSRVTFNDRNLCNFQTYDAYYFALHPNSTTGLYCKLVKYIWIYYQVSIERIWKKIWTTWYIINLFIVSDYYTWSRYYTELKIAPIESTSCLRLSVFNSKYDYITIFEGVFPYSKRVPVLRGSWVNVAVTLEVVQPYQNSFEIKSNNASLDNITISPGACPPGESICFLFQWWNNFKKNCSLPIFFHCLTMFDFSKLRKAWFHQL